MTGLSTLLATFKSLGIKLSVDDEDKLLIRGEKANLTPELIGQIKANKTELIGLLRSAKSGAQKITPQMLPLVKLTQQDIDFIETKVPGGAANIQDIYPLGPLQQGILFHHMMELEGGDPYVMPMLFKIKNEQAYQRFIQGLQFVIDRHDILRTAVIWESLSEAVQVVLRKVTLSIEWVTPPAARQPFEYMQELCDPQLQNMDLDKAPLVHIRVMDVPDSEQYLLLVQFHHMVSDHVGLDIIQQELAAFELGQTAHLAKPMPYREFIAHTLHLAEQHDASEYFRQTLGDIDTPSLPFGLDNIQGDGSRIIELREPLPHEVASSLRTAARQVGVSPAALFHGVWGIMLAGFCDAQDAVFGTVVSGRLQGTTGAAHTVGVFMNTLPFRVTPADCSVSDLVAQVQKALTDLLPYEQASLAAAQRATSIADDAPLFSGMLNYRHSGVVEAPPEQMVESDISMVAGQERSNYPMSLLVDDFSVDFNISVQIDCAVDANKVMICAQQITAKLAHALTHAPATPVSELLSIATDVYQEFSADQRFYAKLLENAPTEQIPSLGSATKKVATHQLALPDISGQDVTKLALQLDVTPLSVWLAIHFRVLSQLSGHDVALSCVADAELSVDASRPMVMTCHLATGPWSGLIAQINQSLKDSEQHGKYPLIATQDQHGVFLREVLLSCSPLTTLGGQYQLQVEIEQSCGHINFHYDQGCYHALQIQNLAELYVKGLLLCLGDVNSESNVSLLDDASLLQLQGLEKGQPHASTPKLLLEDFLAIAEAKPDQQAVVEGETRLNYQQLLVRVRRLGHYLESLDIDSDSRVGVYLPRGIAQVVAVLGVHYAGASYVALESTHPQGRLSYQVSDADIEMLLLSKAQSASEITSGLDVLLMDGVAQDDWLAEYDQGQGHQGLSHQQEAYVLYTSGSTGQPKGVSVSQGNLAHYLAYAKSYLNEDIAGSVVSSPLCFDATITTLLTPLCVGKSLQLLPDGDEAMTVLPDYLNDAKSNWLFKLTPSHLDALSDSVDVNKTAKHMLVIGGEQWLVGSLRRWQGELLPNSTFINEYGPTETVVGTSVFISQATANTAAVAAVEEFADGDGVPIGVPITGSDLFVLGATRLRQPIGSSGELYIGGHGVAQGYLNKPQHSEKAFVEFQGQRVYRTGDVVKRNANGYLVFMGRADEQISLNGYRIEPGDIIGQLLSVDGVSQAEVLLASKAQGTYQVNHLVAYVVASQSQWAQIEAACQRHLSEQLADYMLPAFYIRLDSLPLTANGKLDRRALPSIDTAIEQGAQQMEYVAPNTDIEKAIAEVLSEVLAVDKVGLEDNFFTLGGDSILSIRVVALLKRANISVSISDIFIHQTVAKLAAFVQQQQPSDIAADIEITPFSLLQDDERALIDSEQVEDAYPLSVLQSGMVFHTQMAEFSGVYHDINAEHVVCPWDEALFTQALKDCIDAHPILRTRYQLAGTRPLQLVYRQVPTPLQVEDIRHMDESQQNEYLAQWQLQRQSHQFDWANGPLFQVNIFNRSDDSFAFALSFHHSLLDGWSRASLTTQLYNRYQQLLQGQTPEPLETEYIFREYVALEVQALNRDASKDYFTQMLADAPGQQLPDKLASDVNISDQANPYEQVYFAGFNSRSEKLIALAASIGVPVQILIQAIHIKVLNSISGHPQVLTNVVHNGRPETEGGEQGVGLFLNSLPMVVTLEVGSWRALINQVMAVNNSTMAHRHYPLAQISQQSGLNFDEVLFNYTHFHVFDQMDYDAQGQQLELLDSDGFEQTNFGLTVNLQRGGEIDQVGLQLVYDTSRFDRAIIDKIGRYYLQAADAMLANVDAPCYPLSLLTASERATLLIDRNNTKVDYAKEQTVHGLFEAQVAKAPEAVAVEFEGEQLTYGELNAHADALARLLVHRGVKPDTLVGICLERCFEMVISIMAIIKAGGAYVPLDPDYPSSRLAFMLEDGQIETVLTMSALVDKVPSQDVVLCLDSDEYAKAIKDLSSVSSPLALPTVRPDNLAYVIYTSGSTGQPKGVMIEHRALINRIDWMNREYGSSPSDRILQKTPYSFDVSVWEFIWPLHVGAALVLAKPGGHKTPQYLVDLIRKANISKLHFVPSMLSSLMAQQSLADCPSVKQVFCSGEALPLSLTQSFVEQYKHIELHNLYGPTEAAIDVSYFSCNDGLSSRTSIPIGKPIQNIQLYVLGQDKELLPDGALGELYIGGDGLARGYLNRPELSAERFIENPFYRADTQGDGDNLSPRLYQTGDLVRWLPDGQLAYLGRIDTQVKIRGFRIETGEIEHVISSHSDVQECAVLMAKLPSGDDGLVAYAVPRAKDSEKDSEKGSSDDSQLRDSIRAYVSDELPEHMMPAVIMLLDALPLTTNGKLDRRALPSPDMSSQQQQYVEPITDTEKALSEVWQQVLGLERVGCEDHFFELGGHSLLIMQVIALLQARDVNLEVQDLFSSPKLADLAAVIDAKDVTISYVAPQNLIPDHCDKLTPQMLPLVSLTEQELTVIESMVPGGAANIQDIYPLGPLQEGILFHHTLSADADPYVMPMLFKINSKALVDTFVAGLQFVVNRHDALRTGIIWDGISTAVQVVYKQATVPVTWLANDVQDVAQYMQSLCEPQIQSLDITKAPLLAVKVMADSQTGEHYTLVQFHHIITDHVGLDIVQQEVMAYTTGQTDNLIEPMPYREFIAHTQHLAAQLENKGLENKGEKHDAKSYFDHLLADFSEPTMPFNLTDVQGNVGDIEEVRGVLATDIGKQIRHLAKTLKVSPAVIFHSACAILLGATANQQDVVFGSVLSGRLQGTKGALHTVGVFINTLPIRVKLKGVTALELVKNVQQSLTDLIPHEQASLTLAQQASGIAPDRPLFTAMLNYRHSGIDENAPELPGEPQFEVIAGQERTNLPFTLMVDDMGTDDFGLTIQADASIDVNQVLIYTNNIITGFVKALTEGTKVAEIAILSDAERQQVIDNFGHAASDYPRDTAVHQLFAEQAKRTPDAVAIEFEGQQLTYQQLDDKANQVAAYLIDNGVKPQMLVGFCFKRSIEMIVSMLGILKAGGAYVPLDADYPKARLEYMLNDCQLRLILTQAQLLADFEDIVTNDTALVAVDSQWPTISAVSTDSVDISASADNLAYVIYTSGSTGMPKGVMVEHRAISRLVVNTNYIDITPDDTILQLSSLSFDAATFEVWGALLNGAKLVIAPPQKEVITRLGQLVSDSKVSLMWLTVGLLQTLLNEDSAKQFSQSFSQLRALLTGGDVVPLQLAKQFIEQCPNTTLINSYGPTENTTFSSFYPVTSIHDLQVSALPIGKPLANSRIYILDGNEQPVPVGVVGELYLAGDGLARGYLNQAQMTLDKFVVNPFEQNARMYKSGDLARWRSDGNIEFLGRIDTQVKVRGFRIEIQEIEAELNTHQGVKDSAVVVQGKGSDKQLVACIVTTDTPQGQQLSDGPNQLRDYLQQRLPEYMLPSAFVCIDAIPLTANGKVDRRALERVDVDLSSAYASQYVAPSTEMEQLLIDTWSQVLNIDAAKIGINDNFFELGGHSLLATRLVSRLRTMHEIELPVRTLFEQATVAALAQSLSEQSSHILLPPIVALSADQQAPLSYAQQRLWFIDQMSGGSAQYNVNGAFKLLGALDKAATERALIGIVERHQVLRTSFVDHDGQTSLILNDADIFSLNEVDLRNTVDAQQQLSQLRLDDAMRPFDLSGECLLRVSLIQLQDNEHSVIFNMHHIASDGWSLGILINEFSRLYQAYHHRSSQTIEPDLAPLSIQYQDFANWQRQWLSGDVLEEQLNYWRTNLADIPQVHRLPLDNPRPEQQTFNGGFYGMELDAEQGKALSRLCQSQKITPFIFIHGVLALLLSRYSGEADIVVGSPNAGRAQQEVEPLIGFFVNMLVIRTQVDEQQVFTDYIRSVKDCVLSAYQHQHIPFEMLVEQLNPERSLSHSPIIQILLNVENNEVADFDLPGITLEPVTRDTDQVRFELEISVVQSEMGVQFGWAYNCDLFAESTIARMASHFKSLLLQIIDTPTVVLAELDMLDNRHIQGLVGSDERQQIKAFEQGPQSLAGADVSFLAQVKSQVDKHPRELAVYAHVNDQAQSLSYQQLWQRVERLGHYLQSLDVEQGSRVGIYLPRGIAQVVAVLGVHYVGAAYVALEPSLPEARLLYMTKDADIELLLLSSQLSDSKITKGLDVLLMEGVCDPNWLIEYQHGEAQLPQLQDEAYVLYTSGSTGQPKGVSVNQGHLAHYLAFAANSYLNEQIQGSVVSSPLCFDATITSLFTPLCAGKQVHLLPDGEAALEVLPEYLFDGQAFGDKSWLFKLTPAHLDALSGGQGQGSGEHIVVVGGEQWVVGSLRHWLARLTYSTFINEYGPTETVVGTSTFVAKDADCVANLQDSDGVPIGSPIAASQLYVLGKAGYRQPIGSPGELYIGGGGVTNGYINQPQQTDSCFIDFEGNRVYRSGDLVRWDNAGRMIFIGRADDQISLNGYRIEPQEIRSQLLSVDEIEQAEAIVLSTDKGQLLVAYIVPRDKDLLEQESASASLKDKLRQQLSDDLPEYMVPSAYVMLAAIPLTHNGKVDRRALPSPDLSVQQQAYVAPRTDTEKALSEVWQQVLGLEQVGIEDNFFELGGHSMLVIQVIARLQERGIDLKIRQLFASPKLHQLAADIQGQQVEPSYEAPENLIPADCDVITPQMLPLVSLTEQEIDYIASQIPGGVSNIQDIYPLGPLQEGILFHHTMSTNGDPYVLPMLFRLADDNVVEQFVAGLQFVLNRHDVLRSAVIWQELTTAVQVVCREVKVPVTWLDAPQDKDVETHMFDLCRPELQKLNVSTAPLLAVQVMVDSQTGAHYVLVQFHHLITDHVGMEIVQREVMAHARGATAALAEPMPYREFIAHTQHLGENHDAVDHFTQRLGDFSEPTLPFNLFNVQGDVSDINELQDLLADEVSNKIRTLAKSLQVSPAVIFHAAWALLLAACSNQDDVVFGTVLSGRLQGTKGALNTVGVFINTLPFRAKVADVSPLALVQQVQQSLMELLPYEQASLTIAQQSSAVAMDRPLFTAILNYRHSGAGEVQGEGGESEAESQEPLFQVIGGQERTNFPFTLAVDDLPHGFGLGLQINSAVDIEKVMAYTKNIVARLVDAIEQEHVEQSGQLQAMQISVLPDSERQVLLNDFNQTQVDYPKAQTIHGLFEAQVTKDANAVALEHTFDGDVKQLTYGELDSQANQLAAYLVSRGVQADTLVGICLERSFDMVVAIIAVLKAGGAYVPLDPDYPAARLAFMLDDGKIETVLTVSSLQQRISDIGEGAEQIAVCLDDETIKQQIAQISDIRLPNVSSSDLGYVIYTSGSTGQPKGVMVEHRALINRIDWMDREYGSTPSDRILQKTPYSFDVSVWEFIWPLHVGAALVLAKPAGHKDPEYLARLIAERKITKLHFVPSMLSTLLAQTDLSHCASLQQVFCSGEALPYNLANQFIQSHPNVQLHNLYGPTEAAIDVSYFDCREGLEGRVEVPIGRPIQNIQLYVLGKNGELLPQGALGELHIGGDGLARGYLNRPELSAERFIDNPYQPNSRLYKTGDLVRYLPDGEIAYAGRIDHQVKIRGFRIETGEIEHVICEHQQVQECAVLVLTLPSGDIGLVAYVVMINYTQDDTLQAEFIETLKPFIGQHLPEHMMPGIWMVIEQLPLTANGKLDRRALPEPSVGVMSGVEYEAPRNSLEQQVCDIWSDLLGVEQVGIHDNFFALGGHSLLATRLIGRLRRELEREVPVRAIFDHPTIAALVERFEEFDAQAAMPSITAYSTDENDEEDDDDFELIL